MDDAINAGDESDRVLAVWRLTEPHVVAAARRVPPHPGGPGRTRWPRWPTATPPGPGPTDGARPARRRARGHRAAARADPGAAKAWRHAVRDVLGGLMEEGATVTGFHRKTCYIVERTG